MERVNLKLWSYESGSFVLKAIIDDYEEASWTDSLYEAGDFTITINYNIPNALLFQRGMFIQFGEDETRLGEIQKITDNVGEDGKGSQQRQITGKDARIIFKKRIIKSLNAEGLYEFMGKGELCIRNLVYSQCGAGAELKRQLPVTNTIPLDVNAIGEVYYVSESFTNLYEALSKIATQTKIGWRIRFHSRTLVLECFAGTDRSTTVFFSTDYDTLKDGTFSDSSESFANTVYVGGKGSGADRDIYEGEKLEGGVTPSGLDRYEAWDNQSSMTTEDEYTAEANNVLIQYGNTIEVSGNGLIKSSYIYNENYFLGDTIKLAFSGKSADVQILGVTEVWSAGGKDISFSFGKSINDLSKQLNLMMTAIQNASNKNSTTDSVKWYTIPTDTEMNKASSIYNTIGFIGNVGAGATFKLYWDDERNGCKSYHVYIKELTGAGYLTLTTGVAGAQDLVLNAGTYVAIIYVDTSGNVNSQACTASSVVAQGNNQPVTSDAVYQALQTASGGVTIRRLKDADTSATGSTYSLDSGESFLDWDFIIPIVTLYDSEQQQTQFIPKGEIEWQIAHQSTDNAFMQCGSTGGTDRRLAWCPKSATTYRVGIRNGTSGHLPHLWGFYGVKFGI